MLVLQVTRVAEIKGMVKFITGFIKLVVIHVISSFVISNGYLPIFRKHVQFDAFILVTYEHFKKPLAALKLIECKMYFDKVKSQKVASKFSVVRCCLSCLLKLPEQCFH